MEVFKELFKAKQEWCSQDKVHDYPAYSNTHEHSLEAVDSWKLPFSLTPIFAKAGGRSILPILINNRNLIVKALAALERHKRNQVAKDKVINLKFQNDGVVYHGHAVLAEDEVNCVYECEQGLRYL